MDLSITRARIQMKQIKLLEKNRKLKDVEEKNRKMLAKRSNWNSRKPRKEDSKN
jgi:hypothetical protein